MGRYMDRKWLKTMDKYVHSQECGDKNIALIYALAVRLYVLFHSFSGLSQLAHM